MFIIGITGGTGAGKTSAMNALRSFGAGLLDCDEIYHELLQNNHEMQSEIESRFENVTADNKIDRKKLGEKVWNNPDALNDLNKITHKYISTEIDKRLKAISDKDGKVAAIDAIALIESGQSEKCNIIIGITAPKEMRITRITARDNITKEQALLRINAQQTEEFYKDRCDFILENTFESQEKFGEVCKEFFKNLINNGR